MFYVKCKLMGNTCQYQYISISMALGNVSVYRCCVLLFIIFHLVPITMIHKSIGMCTIVALHCYIYTIKCISKNLCLQMIVSSPMSFCWAEWNTWHKVHGDVCLNQPDCGALLHLQGTWPASRSTAISISNEGPRQCLNHVTTAALAKATGGVVGVGAFIDWDFRLVQRGWSPY